MSERKESLIGACKLMSPGYSTIFWLLILVFIGAAFLAGNHIAIANNEDSYKNSDTEIAEMKDKIETLRKQLNIEQKVHKHTRKISSEISKQRDIMMKQARKILKKERFLSLYLEYKLAEDGGADDEQLNNMLQQLDDYVFKGVMKNKVLHHKGGKEITMIEFEDGSIWDLPFTADNHGIK